jgi:hypothetical protein
MPTDLTLSLPEALAEADRHRGNGAARCRALAETYAPEGKMVRRTYGDLDREAFLDIAWQEMRATKVLTPAVRPRTLREVARQLDDQFTSFDSVANAPAIPGQLRPDWFRVCAEIEVDGWQWDRSVPPWLIPATISERRHSERTTLYLLEGNHSAAVLAHELYIGKIAWQPVETVVCLAPRDEIDAVLSGEPRAPRLANDNLR